jgi:allophanate hydrolase subunit 1
LFDATANAERWLEESQRECYEQVEELTLQQTWRSKLCLAIVGPLRVRSHLSKRMRIAALRHAEMAKEFASLQAVVSSTAEFMLEYTPNEVFRVEVVDDMIAKFWKQEERQSHLERPSTRVYDMILGPPFGWA